VAAGRLSATRAETKKPPEGGFSLRRETAYFEAALIAAEAAALAEFAASVAAEAADIAELMADEAASVDGVVTTVVVDGAGVVVAGGGVVVVVVVSSFLLHAANETAAARVTISSAVFMFLLDIKVRQTRRSVWEPSGEEPHRPQDMGRASASSA
jgi:hypothetical protein